MLEVTCLEGGVSRGGVTTSHSAPVRPTIFNFLAQTASNELTSPSTSTCRNNFLQNINASKTKQRKRQHKSHDDVTSDDVSSAKRSKDCATKQVNVV